MFTHLYCIYAIVAIAYATLTDNYCCKDQNVLKDDENICFNSVANATSPTILVCNSTFRLTDMETNLTELLITLEEQGAPDSFCIANETSNSTELTVVLCETYEPPPLVEEHILGICMFISVIFLVPTIVIYSLLPELRDLQGKSITNFCVSLTLALFILGIMKTTTAPDWTTCAVQAFLVYLFFLAAFFWTNAISIQILHNIRRPPSSDYGWKQFLWYALYSYGLPILLTVAMAIVNYHPGHHTKPGIGLNSCWFYSKEQQWYYMYSVMSILLAVNICIFIYISLYLWRGSYSSSHVKALRYKFVMTIRLLIITGLPWIFEMISSLSPPHVIWTIIDIFNILQGLLIFLVLVVFRRRVVKALYKRGYLNCISGLVERHLAVGDDEENVVEHTRAEALEFNDKN